ncbi:hypothetical protein [Pseudomonas sp. 24 E 13]|nr:hypothetical protein [Pseudomonas sp. 24 E 13]
MALLVIGEDHAATAHQRQAQFQAADIEGHGGQRQVALHAVQRQGALHRQQEVGKVAPADLHTLGLPGGAGGVERVGQLLQVPGQRRCIGRLRLQRQVLPELAAQRGREMLILKVAQQQMRPCPLHDGRLPRRRMARIERQVLRPGLLDAQQADQQALVARQAEGDRGLRRHTLRQQPVRKLVGLCLQLPVAQLSVAAEHGGALGMQGGLNLEAGHEIRLDVQFGSVARAVQALYRAQWQRQQRLLQIEMRQAGQHTQVVVHQALDAGRVEQRGGVLDDQLAAGPIAAALAEHIEGQVELGADRPLRQCQRRYRDARQLQIALAEVIDLVVEHGLEQWRAVEAALDLEHIEQALERQLLMGPIICQALAKAPQKMLQAF